MRFTDEETERAIAVLTAVQRDSGKPLPLPDAVNCLAQRAEAGDSAAATALYAARLRLIFPTVPCPPYRSERARLWESIVGGRYEGIRVAERLDYRQAVSDRKDGWFRLGSATERYLSLRIRQELAQILAGE